MVECVHLLPLDDATLPSIRLPAVQPSKRRKAAQIHHKCRHCPAAHKRHTQRCVLQHSSHVFSRCLRHLRSFKQCTRLRFQLQADTGGKLLRAGWHHWRHRHDSLPLTVSSPVPCTNKHAIGRGILPRRLESREWNGNWDGRGSRALRKPSRPCRASLGHAKLWRDSATRTMRRPCSTACSQATLYPATAAYSFWRALAIRKPYFSTARFSMQRPETEL